MTRDALGQQAAELTRLMPQLMRSVFTLDESDPAIDLTVAQLRVCSILNDGRLTVSGLARELGTSVSAVTQIADRLESSGMVERLAGTQDRRTRSLRLTDHGTGLLRAREGRRVRRAHQVLRELSPATRKRVLNALHVLIEACSAGASTCEERGNTEESGIELRRSLTAGGRLQSR
jgi:DNA-binding MarR family transcriptional regulator